MAYWPLRAAISASSRPCWRRRRAESTLTCRKMKPLSPSAVPITTTIASRLNFVEIRLRSIERRPSLLEDPIGPAYQEIRELQLHVTRRLEVDRVGDAARALRSDGCDTRPRKDPHRSLRALASDVLVVP